MNWYWQHRDGHCQGIQNDQRAPAGPGIRQQLGHVQDSDWDMGDGEAVACEQAKTVRPERGSA